jgi:phospholipid/cholesterol/gamma-HCH transport system substrate-binding protein
VSAATAIVDRAANVQRSPRALAVLGIALTALLVASIAGIVLTFSGTFTSFVPVQAVIAGDGNAVVKGNEVIYRDVPVGVVASSGTVTAHGDVVVTLHIIPNRASAIPANVTATVDPVTIFGTEYVILQAPAAPAAAHLTAGITISPTKSASGANVQGAISSLDSILNALHPAQLDTALTAIATALSGQGTGIGKTLDSIDSYLKTQLPHFPEFEADLGLLAPVANQVAASAPALVGSLSNLTTTSETITSHSSELRQVLTGGSGVANQLYSVLAPTQQPLEKILAAAGPFFADVSQSPTELSQIVNGLSTWATSWAAAESNGPYLSFSASVPIANATDLVFAALDAPGSAGPDGLSAQALGASNVDPAPYSSRAVASTSSADIDPAVITPHEQLAAVTVATSLDRGRPPGSPAVSTLLLDPLLSELVLQS